MKKWLTIICLILLLSPVKAQQMEVVDFTRQKWGFLHGMLKKQKVEIDKKLALLDLTTGEKGFEFKADGTTPVKAEEGDGLLTLKVPHKTSFIVIKHPDYGQLTWKVPHRLLKKKKHYKGTLLTYSPDKEYKLEKQWVVFRTEPQNVILTVDSTTMLLRDGKAQLYLPLGKHTYRMESPFYEAVEDSLELTDSVKIVIPVKLTPVYSYVTVRSGLEGSDIYIDGASIGRTVATSGHLQAGSHRLTVLSGDYCYYDKEILIRPAEKKVIDLSDSVMTPVLYQRSVPDRHENRPASSKRGSLSDRRDIAVIPSNMPLNRIMAPVTIEAINDSTEILIDTEPVGFGRWEGKLSGGFHAISTRRGNVESSFQYLWIDDEQPKTMNLLSPLADYGVLNIHSNVVGADIYIDNIKAGETPCTLERLPAGKSYRIHLCKDGYRQAGKTVKVIANDMVDVMIKLKIEN